MKPVFTSATEQDINEALDWYEAQTSGLGQQFHDEIQRQSRRMVKPWQFPVVYADVRKAGLQRFPYNLFFRHIDDTVVVIACFHTRRHPGILKGRL